jgi:KipI family sensor histidine kinase inhibitor
LTTLLVSIDPDVTDASALRAAITDMEPGPATATDDERHVIDVRYDGEDLAEVARLTGLAVEQVVAAHTGTSWRVAFCGFAPGFSYLVGGDPRLRVPRRDEARVRVPAGAVALAGEFSSIYPRVSPGGWQLVGHTDTVLWDAAADPPAVLRPGAVVEFRDVTR